MLMNFYIFCIGAVHKRRPQSGGVIQCGHFADKGRGCVRTGRELRQGGQGGRVSFLRFCSDVFYGRQRCCFFFHFIQVSTNGKFGFRMRTILLSQADFCSWICNYIQYY